MSNRKFDMIEDGMIKTLAVDHLLPRSHLHKVYSLAFILRTIQEVIIDNT
jgi:hypothetical protein